MDPSMVIVYSVITLSLLIALAAVSTVLILIAIRWNQNRLQKITTQTPTTTAVS